MSNFDAFRILGSIEAQGGNTKFPKIPSDEILNEEELNAAEVLYELANGPGPLLENGVTQISDCNWTGQGWQHVEEMKALTNIMPDFACTIDKKAEKKLGKRKFGEDGSTSRSRRKVKHLIAVHDVDDHNDCSVQDLCNKAITDRLGRQNYLHTGSGKRITGTSSTNRFNLLGSYLQPNFSSKTIQIPSEKGLQLSAIITPTYPAEFSFSVMHLLSAVRAALTIPLPVEYALRFGRPLCSNQILSEKSPVGTIYYQEFIEKNLPFLNIYQIVQRVRSKPGDPRILQCQEPLIELVRGVLKIFSSEMPPLGAIHWEPLTVYDRLRKRWRWIGPVPCSLTHENCSEVDISCTAWGLLQENLVKLANQFSIWLKRVHPTLELIASLPEPPRELMQEKDFHRRFNNRKRLNQSTIHQSCDEVRAYFHREEAIRYLIPDRGFLYTTLDGKKSAVAPLRKNSSKAFTKSRGHYIFKSNRPPQFSLLSLVRDAAARLPGGMGTRADICNLIRDSQYVIENIPEKTVKQIVSGALDRLQCELDPCVEYVGQWGLWVYLHKDREEEDFTENGDLIDAAAATSPCANIVSS